MVHAIALTPPFGEAEYHRVAEEVGPEPLDGGLLHLCLRRPEGGVQYIQVWESAHDFEQTSQERILPAIARALGSFDRDAVVIEPLDVVEMQGPFASGRGVALAQEGVTAWNAGDLEAFVSVYGEDCELVTPSSSGKGRGAVRDFWNATMTAFPGSQLRNVELVAVGDRVYEEGVVEGVNSGPSVGPDGSEIPATGRAISMPYLGVHRVVDDEIVSSRLYWDELGMIGQMGLV